MAEDIRPPDPEGDLPPEFIDQSPLLRQLFYERRFRVTLVLLLIGGTLGAALLGRFIPATPAGVEPRIRISGIDILQAWSLARSARKLEEAGQLREAMEAWGAASANHPGRPDLHRHVLRLMAMENPPDPRSLTNGLGRAGWLMTLAGTNSTDLSLTARLYRHHGLGDIALRILEPNESILDAESTGLYLELLFAQGQFKRFGELWERLPEATREDPRLQLHHRAWQAEWAPPGEQRAGEAALEEARNDPQLRDLANRLRLSVAGARGDLAGFRESLDDLVAARADRVDDHVRYWSALVQAGRRDEAAALARAYSRPPGSAGECRDFATLLVRLGETGEADRMLEEGITQFDDPELWLLRSQLLRQSKRWDDLALLGTTLRTASRWRDAIGGFGWFLAGYAELQQGREERARASFDSAAHSPISVPYFALLTASELTRQGLGDEAESMLRELREGFADFAPFWHELAIAAYRAQRIEDMRDAAAEAVRLDPGNPVFANNLAAALLILRERTSEALTLTLTAKARRPNDLAARINHAQALVQAGRLDDAAAELAPLPDGGLSSSEASSMALVRFEIALRRGQRQEALRQYALVQRDALAAPEKQWLEKEYQSVVGSPEEPAESP